MENAQDDLDRAARLAAVRAWSEADKNIVEGLGKLAIELRKVGSEFSKLILTNLIVINAAGVLAVPTLAKTFLGLESLNSRDDKLFYLGVPMTLFIAGLGCAFLSAFFTYRNWIMHAQAIDCDAQQRRWEAEIMHVGDYHPEGRGDLLQSLATTPARRSKIARGITRSYWAALVFGWAAASAFVAGCVWLAWHLR